MFLGDLYYFNSHARVGRDPYNLRRSHLRQISTHTPAWGVTSCAITMYSVALYFNSHARVGRDRSL